MGWIVTLVVGGIVGWLASIVMKTNAQMGIVANVVVGVVGSMIGYWIAGALGMRTGGGWLRYLIAVAGAALLIWVLKALKIYK